MEPNLSQITGIQGDADIAGGTAGGGTESAYIIPEGKSIQYLQEAAEAKAEANKYIGKMYQDNLNKHLADINNVDFTNVMDTDMPALKQKYADLAHDMGANYDVIRNPNIDPVKYAELHQKESELLGLIAQSKSHSAIQNYNKKLLLDHPDWNTPDNKQQVLNYASTPMADRKDYLLNTPTTFDLAKTAKAAADIALQQTKKESVSKNGNWLNTTEAKEYNQAKYKEAIHGLLDNTTINGRSSRQEFEKLYNSLPEDVRSKYQDSNDYLDQNAERLRPMGESSSTFTINPFALQRQSQAFQASESAKARELQNRALKKGEIKPEEAGEAKFRALGNLVNNGTINPTYGQNIWGDNTSTVLKAVKVPVKNSDGSSATGNDGLPLYETDKIKVPEIQFTGTSIDEKGNIIIHRIDNKNNKPLPDITRNYSQLYSDMDNMLGINYTGAVSSGSHMYSNKYFKKVTADQDDITKHFNIPIDPNAEILDPEYIKRKALADKYRAETGHAHPNEARYVGKPHVRGELNSLNTPGTSYKATNGQSYKHDDLIKLGYTDDQIQEAIKLGNLKQ